MKRILLYAAAFGLTALSAFAYGVADTGSGGSASGPVIEKEFSVGSFETIRLTGIGKVVYERSSEYVVVVRTNASLMDEVKVERRSDALELGFRDGFNLRGPSTLEFHVFAPDLSGVSLTGSGSFSAADPIAGGEFEIKISGSGDAEAELDVKRVECSISGSGNIVLTGRTDLIEVAIGGSGSVRAADLRANTAEITVSGSGNVAVYAEKKLEASIAGSGNVFYKGNPIIDFSGSGSGRLKSMK